MDKALEWDGMNTKGRLVPPKTNVVVRIWTSSDMHTCVEATELPTVGYGMHTFGVRLLSACVGATDTIGGWLLGIDVVIA
eukprot:4334166-Amphidinium_carterae.1